MTDFSKLFINPSLLSPWIDCSSIVCALKLCGVYQLNSQPIGLAPTNNMKISFPQLQSAEVTRYANEDEETSSSSSTIPRLVSQNVMHVPENSFRVFEKVNQFDIEIVVGCLNDSYSSGKCWIIGSEPNIIPKEEQRTKLFTRWAKIQNDRLKLQGKGSQVISFQVQNTYTMAFELKNSKQYSPQQSKSSIRHLIVQHFIPFLKWHFNNQAKLSKISRKYKILIEQYYSRVKNVTLSKAAPKPKRLPVNGILSESKGRNYDLTLAEDDIQKRLDEFNNQRNVEASRFVKRLNVTAIQLIKQEPQVINEPKKQTSQKNTTKSISAVKAVGITEELNKGGHSNINVMLCEYHINNSTNPDVENFCKEKEKASLVWKEAKDTQCSKFIRNENLILNACRNTLCSPYIGRFFLARGHDEVVMSKLERKTLKQYLDEKRPFQEKITTLFGVVEALQHLYEKKIIHRDIKKENYLIHMAPIPANCELKYGYPFPKLIDFGLAYIIGGDTKIVGSGTNGCYLPYQTYKNNQNLSNGKKLGFLEFRTHPKTDIYGLGQLINTFFSIKDVEYIFLEEHLKQLSHECMNMEPQKRLSCQEIMYVISLINKYVKEIKVTMQSRPVQSIKVQDKPTE